MLPVTPAFSINQDYMSQFLEEFLVSRKYTMFKLRYLRGKKMHILKTLTCIQIDIRAIMYVINSEFIDNLCAYCQKTVNICRVHGRAVCLRS